MSLIQNKAVYRASFACLRGLLDMLLEVPANLRDTPMIEIGSNVGESTQIFSLFFSPVYSVDPFLDAGLAGRYQLEVEQEFNRRTFGRNVIHINMPSDQAANRLPDNISLVYIDGAHDYASVKNDILLYLPKIKKGGLICGHDYDNLHHPAVTPAIAECLGRPDKTFIDTSWMKAV